MRLDSDTTAHEEAVYASNGADGYTDLLLRHHNAICRALNSKRIEEGRSWLSKKFITRDNPEGFFLRITPHEARYIIPRWARYDQFVDAEVNFCRVMDPLAVARGAA